MGEDLTTRAYEMGYEHGRAAGSWVVDGDMTGEIEAYKWLLHGVDDGDPVVLDALPSGPLSGEWADGPTPASVLADLGVDDEDPDVDTDDLLFEFESGFDAGVADEVTEICRRFVSEGEVV
jgi:hypothetical protein